MMIGAPFVVERAWAFMKAVLPPPAIIAELASRPILNYGRFTPMTMKAIRHELADLMKRTGRTRAENHRRYALEAEINYRKRTHKGAL